RDLVAPATRNRRRRDPAAHENPPSSWPNPAIAVTWTCRADVARGVTYEGSRREAIRSPDRAAQRRTKMSNAVAKSPRKPQPMNGVDAPALFATVDAVRSQPELAKFRFRASNTWQQGAHSRSRIESFYGASAEQKHEREFTYDSDHPAVLVGRD